MTIKQLVDRLYAKARDLDDEGAHARAHELRAMVSDVRRAASEVENYRPKRRS